MHVLTDQPDDTSVSDDLLVRPKVKICFYGIKPHLDCYCEEHVHLRCASETWHANCLSLPSQYCTLAHISRESFLQYDTALFFFGIFQYKRLPSSSCVKNWKDVMYFLVMNGIWDVQRVLNMKCSLLIPLLFMNILGAYILLTCKMCEIIWWNCRHVVTSLNPEALMPFLSW